MEKTVVVHRALRQIVRIIALIGCLWVVCHAHPAWSAPPSASSEFARSPMLRIHGFGTLQQANQAGAFPEFFFFILPLVLGIPALVGIVGSAYLFHIQDTQAISHHNRLPLVWGIGSLVFGTAAAVYGCLMLSPVLGVLLAMGIPLLIVGIVAVGLGIANLVRYKVMQDEQQDAYHAETPSLSLAVGITSVHFTIRF